MSISYSGIVNYGKAILPSVESWGSNNNILRDPPRSITTRRIDKVSETSMIDQDIQESGNRVAESILVYPRGQNVMVGVSFDNNGSNGGNRVGQTLLYGGQQTKLPYRIMRDGAFIPPILREFDLLPLSRLPRVNTRVDPVAYTADFKRKIVCPGTAKDYRSVKNDTIQINTTAPKMQYIRKPVEIGVSENIQKNLLQVQGKTQKILNISRPVEVAVGQNIQPKIQVQGETIKTQSVEHPVEVGVGQHIQYKLPVQGQTTKVQNVDRPVEVAVGQHIQHKLPVQGQTTKVQNVDRPVEVAVGQHIQSKLPVQGQTTKVQNVDRPVEVAVGQHIQSKLPVQGQTTKVQNVDRPVEVAVGQHIQDHLNVSADSNVRYYDYTQRSTKYTGDSVLNQVIHCQANALPVQNIHKVPVQSQIVYQPNLRPQSHTSTVSNTKGLGTKHNHFEVQKIRQRPNLSSSVKPNFSRKGMYDSNAIDPTSRVAHLPDRPNIGGKDGVQMIPTFDRNWGEMKLKGRGFYDLMNKKS
jgi:hypothetical protein